jgi:ketosteroid isomerase-like protein
MLARALLVTLLSLSTAAVSRAADTLADEREILRLHKSLIDAWQKNDVATLNSLIADEFQYWSFKGERRDKADLLKLVAKSHTSGDTDTQTEVEDPVVRVYGDSAILTCRIIDTGKHPAGKRFTAKTADTHSTSGTMANGC